jgi:hypothetical protein
MTPLRTLSTAALVAVGGAEVLVLSAAGATGRPDVQSALLITLGAIATSAGFAALLGAAFSAGRGGGGEVAAPGGIAPESHGTMRVRERTIAPEPTYAGEPDGEWTADGEWNDAFVWDGTFTEEALAEIRAGLERDAHLYAPAEITQVDMAPVDVTQRIPPVLPPLWTPPAAPAVTVAPNALPATGTGYVVIEREHAAARATRHQAPERQGRDVVEENPDDWFRAPSRHAKSAA